MDKYAETAVVAAVAGTVASELREVVVPVAAAELELVVGRQEPVVVAFDIAEQVLVLVVQ